MFNSVACAYWICISLCLFAVITSGLVFVWGLLVWLVDCAVVVVFVICVVFVWWAYSGISGAGLCL